MLKFYTSIVFVFFLLFVSAQNETIDNNKPDEAVDTTFEKPGYVILDSDTLFTINTALGSFSPTERADAINARLKQLEKELSIDNEAFKIAEDVHYSMILYKDMPILSVSDQDALYGNASRSELTVSYLTSIKNTIKQNVEDRSLIYWGLHVLYTLLAFAGLIVIFKLVNRGIRWLTKYVEHYQAQIKKKRKSFWRYLAPNGPDNFFAFTLKVFKILLLAVILILYLPLMFSFLPWTENLVSRFYEFISVPITIIFQGLWIFISEKLIVIVIIFFISRYLLRILSYVSGEIEKEKLKIKGFHREWAKPTYNIFRILLIAFTLVFMFPYLPGAQSPAFKGVSIFLGVLFSLGSTSAIANIVAGIVITYMRPFQIGDRVKIGDAVGDIVEKNLLVTRLKTLKNEDVTIPNANIINTHLWNYTKNASKLGIILHPTVTIGYDVPSEKVIELLLKAAQNTKNLTRDFKPFVLQKSLGDFYIEYELNVYTKQPGKMAHFYSELYKSILNEFNKAEIEILSPHYTAMRDGNASTIPNQKPSSGPSNPVNDIIDKITKSGQ